MKILLLGKDGQVGTELQRTLLPLGDVIAIGRSDLNLENFSGLADLLNLHSPGIIVNAAAYTAVDKAETDQDTAFMINSHLVSALADFAKKNNALLIHYSTDYVFDGEKLAAYVETDPVNPKNIYGVSKQAGEEAIIQSNCKFLIFRTSWVFSSTGKNFIRTILNLAKEKDSLRIVADQYGAPTSAELIADVTALAISSYYKEKIQNGIYHLTPTGSTNWHNLACYVVNKALNNGMNLKLTSEQIHPISANEYPLPAKRPKNSKLDNSALSSALTLHIPDWTVHVDRAINQLTQLELSI